MFSGLVEKLAVVLDVRSQPPGRRLAVAVDDWAGDVRLGDSIAVNGCCLTVVASAAGAVEFDAGPETLRCTNLGDLAPGAHVNLERSLRIGDRLGGHFVTGHVDAVARVAARHEEGEWTFMTFRLPPALVEFMVPKGSIAVDGVSLTLVDVGDDEFRVMLIPHTLAVTTLGARRLGDRVNVETDLLAKYARKAAL